MPINFGATTVLGVEDMGGTTVLSAPSAAAPKPSPYLLRRKNNERIPLNKPVFRIGKEKSYVDYFIGDNTAISRSHCNIHTDNGEYYIEDGENLRSENWRNRMFQLFAMNSLIKDSKELRDRILYERIPSGEIYLTTVVEAMRDNCVLEMTYQGFAKKEPSTFLVEPYCIKMFKQRWYMVARSPYLDKIRVYSLDRILELETDKEKKFKLPRTFDASVYFDECFGVIAGDGTNVENVKLKVSVEQANYLRSLPLHRSQQELERTDTYSIFHFRVRPSYDFQQEILWHGEEMEVLEPLWLREEIAGKIEKMWNKYKS